MKTWSQFREEIRVGLLADTNSTRYRWSDDALFAYLGWAQNVFVEHTALEKHVTQTGDGATDSYALADRYEELVTTAVVYSLQSNKPTYYKPERLPTYAPLSFWEEPAGTLKLGKALANGVELHVRYFAYYPAPATKDDDAFVLALPDWAFSAVAYRIAAYAFAPRSVRSSNIDQFKGARDKGTPEDNTWREQYRSFIKLYEMELANHRRQIRTNYQKKQR